jgi:PAS domain S-box-containing protein
MTQPASPTNAILNAVHAFPGRFLVVTPDFRILAAAGGPAETPAPDLAGRRCHDAVCSREEPCPGCAVVAVLATGAPAWSTLPDEGPGGGRPLCHFAFPIGTEGRVEAVAALAIAPPPHVDAEDRLRRSNALLRNLIVSCVDGVIAADKSGKVIIFNEAASQIFGYPVAEALERLDVRAIYPDGREREIMRQLRGNEHGGPGKLRSYTVEVLHRDGTRIPINLSAAIVYEDGREVATIGFFHDLRDRLRMQRELERTQLQLLQAEKMASLGKLAAGVAHQLNNPLGGITLFTRLILEEYALPPGAREDLGRVLNDAERCRETVKELLEFTRQTRHLMRPQDVNQAIARTLFLLKSQSLFHDIAIETELDPGLPAVHSDIQQLNHLFMNIILNAAQAMSGRGRLQVQTGPSEAAGYVKIRISDTGPGIPPEVLPHIFDPFFTTKAEGEGTGLGLSLAYGIVENHRGRIKAVSELGQGASFVIELPVKEPDAAAGRRGTGSDSGPA